MIELSRILVRQFRAVLRKSILAADPRGPCPLVVCRAGRRGLTLSCQRGKLGVRHHTPGSFPAASVAVPFAKWAELENAGAMIALEQITPFTARATWQADEGLRALDFDTADPSSSAPAPEPARNATSLEAGFLTALDEASRTASRDAVRFATNRILLRGRDGTLVATDGRQLLLQGGFRFPWKDDRYLPALPVFAGRELPREPPIGLGLSKERITLEVGPWLFDFEIEENSRFPDVEKVLPNTRSALTRLHLDARDIEDLVRRLPRLPGHDDPRRPVTLDLGDTVVVRARSDKEGISEVVLCHARREGPMLRIETDRHYLLRALKLGFTEILIADSQQPLFCKDATRTYLWMPLSDADSVSDSPVANADTMRPVSPSPTALPETAPRTTNMPTNEPRSHGYARGSADPGEAIDPIAEAEALRVQLQAALTRTSRLIASLKQQRRESRVVETALATLRRLQQT